MTRTKLLALALCMFCLLNTCFASAEMTFAPTAQAETTLRALVATSGAVINGRGKCSSVPGYTSTVYVYIQKYINGTWVSVSSDSGTGSATTSAIMEVGCSYRVYATCRVYDVEGVLFDSDYAYSATIRY